MVRSALQTAAGQAPVRPRLPEKATEPFPVQPGVSVRPGGSRARQSEQRRCRTERRCSGVPLKSARLLCRGQRPANPRSSRYSVLCFEQQVVSTKSMVLMLTQKCKGSAITLNGQLNNYSPGNFVFMVNVCVSSRRIKSSLGSPTTLRVKGPTNKRCEDCWCRRGPVGPRLTGRGGSKGSVRWTDSLPSFRSTEARAGHRVLTVAEAAGWPVNWQVPSARGGKGMHTPRRTHLLSRDRSRTQARWPPRSA